MRLTKPDIIEDTSPCSRWARVGAERAGTESRGSRNRPEEPRRDGCGSRPRGAAGGEAKERRPPQLPLEAAAAPDQAAQRPRPRARRRSRSSRAPADWASPVRRRRAYWIVLGSRHRRACIAFYAMFTFVRFEIFKLLLASFFPLAVMILAVLGSIVFGLATPTEAAAVGSFGGFVLAAIYALLKLPPEKRRADLRRLDSVCGADRRFDRLVPPAQIRGSWSPGRRFG
jgi:hypothetical protein